MRPVGGKTSPLKNPPRDLGIYNLVFTIIAFKCGVKVMGKMGEYGTRLNKGQSQ